MLNQAGVIFGQTHVSSNEMMILPGPSRPAACTGTDALLLFADLKEGKGLEEDFHGRRLIKKKMLGVRVNSCSHQKKKTKQSPQSPLVQSAVGCFDGLLKKPFEEILHFAHRTYESEWRAARTCETLKSDKCRISFAKCPVLRFPFP